MSDRGVLFVFSLGVILASLTVAVWLMATGQARYVDGLFLLISCLVLALAFGLYVRYVIRSAMASAPAAATVKSVSAARKKPTPAAPAAAEQTAAKAR